jgi:hypothetical protein
VQKLNYKRYGNFFDCSRSRPCTPILHHALHRKLNPLYLYGPRLYFGQSTFDNATLSLPPPQLVTLSRPIFLECQYSPSLESPSTSLATHRLPSSRILHNFEKKWKFLQSFFFIQLTSSLSNSPLPYPTPFFLIQLTSSLYNHFLPSKTPSISKLPPY